jgi:hypothetical protein
VLRSPGSRAAEREDMSSWRMLGGDRPGDLRDECCFICKDGGDHLRACGFK